MSKDSGQVNVPSPGYGAEVTAPVFPLLGKQWRPWSHQNKSPWKTRSKSVFVIIKFEKSVHKTLCGMNTHTHFRADCWQVILSCRQMTHHTQQCWMQLHFTHGFGTETSQIHHRVCPSMSWASQISWDTALGMVSGVGWQDRVVCALLVHHSCPVTPFLFEGK